MERPKKLTKELAKLPKIMHKGSVMLDSLYVVAAPVAAPWVELSVSIRMDDNFDKLVKLVNWDTRANTDTRHNSCPRR